MTNPFYDWRNPAVPCTWQKGYTKQPHVVAVNERIQQWSDGLLTLRELAWFIDEQYKQAYLEGKEDAHYQVPAIDYYNSPDPNHLPIGNIMEWSIPVAVQLKFRT